jgi:hypothetical protein
MKDRHDRIDAWTALAAVALGTVALGTVVLATAVIASPAAQQGAALPQAQPGAALPQTLDAYLTNSVKLDAQARAQLLAGSPVTKLLDSDQSKEVAVFGAVWVNAPVERYLAAVDDIERFESGPSFRATKKVSSPPRLEDFAKLSLTDEDIKDLKACRVSQCQVKLAESAIERMRHEIDWTRPDAPDQANRLARQLAFEYVTEYLKGGNDELAVYRDAERPTFVAKEFKELIDKMPAISESVQNVRQYLLDFPRAALPDSDSFIYWQDAAFGLKPTIRINHFVTARTPEGAIVASKMLYASHYFWTALEFRVLLRDSARGNGFWFVSENRSRSDGLTGFGARVIRGKVRSGAEKGSQTQLELTKKTMEAR